MELLTALIATLIVSLMSLIGIIFIALKKTKLDNILLYLVALSAGALVGGAFLHLIPEAIEETKGLMPFILVIGGIMVFFLIEKILHWHHCHDEDNCDVHTFTYMNLIGDGIHNFLDGMIIYSAFAINFNVGLAATVAIVFHEIPQEIGDFGVLVHGGFSKLKALVWNFLSASAAFLGVFVSFLLAGMFDLFNMILVPLAAGGFIYIAMTDLVPELHKETNLKKSLSNFSFFIIGLSFMFIIKMYFG